MHAALIGESPGSMWLAVEDKEAEDIEGCYHLSSDHCLTNLEQKLVDDTKVQELEAERLKDDLEQAAVLEVLHADLEVVESEYIDDGTPQHITTSSIETKKLRQPFDSHRCHRMTICTKSKSSTYILNNCNNLIVGELLLTET